MLVLSLLMACVDQAPLAPDEALARTVTSALVRGDHVVALGGLELRVNPDAWVRPGPGGPEVVARVRTNRDLDRLFTFVPDDGFGFADLRGPRRFEVGGGAGSELATLFSGAPLLIDIDTVSGQPTDVTGWVTFQPVVRATVSSADLRVRGARPVRLRNAAVPVRYRVEIEANRPFTTVELTAPAGAAPELTARSTTRWTLDADHATWVWMASGATTLTFDGVETVALQVGARVKGAGLTDEDPYVTVYPDCAPATLVCLDAVVGVDTSVCGPAFEVGRCYGADRCSARAATPLVLSPVETPGVASYAEAWNAAASNGGVWGSVAAPEVLEYPACPTITADLRSLTEAAILVDADFAGFDYAWGEELDRAGLANAAHFGSSYSSAGPALLAAVELFGGGGTVRAWHGEVEVPCPNCHEWLDLYVIWFEDRQQVVVVRGSHGWDS